MSICEVSHLDDPLICAKPATLEIFWMQITKLVVIKRGGALNQRVLGETYRQERGRMLGHCSMQSAKAVMTPLTELKGTNLHDDTVSHKMVIAQTHIACTCKFDTFPESAEMLEKNTLPETLPNDTCIETEGPEQDLGTRHGIF